MSDQELNELESPENWSDDEGEVRPGLKTQRAVVSVAFSRQDLEQVSEYALRQGMKTSEFIRTAALTEATKRPQGVRIISVTGPVHTGFMPSMLRASRAIVKIEQDEVAFTR